MHIAVHRDQTRYCTHRRILYSFCLSCYTHCIALHFGCTNIKMRSKNRRPVFLGKQWAGSKRHGQYKQFVSWTENTILKKNSTTAKEPALCVTSFHKLWHACCVTPLYVQRHWPAKYQQLYLQRKGYQAGNHESAFCIAAVRCSKSARRNNSSMPAISTGQ